MKPCSPRVGTNLKELSACCYGGQGCTLAPFAIKTSIGAEQTARVGGYAGTGPKQEPQCEQPSQEARLELSTDASLQDLYLLISALSRGGFTVSVSVQVTPASAPSLSATAEPSICSIADWHLIELPHCWAVVGMYLSDTTRR